MKSFYFIAILSAFAAGASAQMLNVLHAFSGSDGANPERTLLQDGNTFYGVTSYGGPSSTGVLFRMNTDGSDFQVLYSGDLTDWLNPNSLVVDGDTLYGTTQGGGTNSGGTVYTISKNGSNYKVLKFFGGSAGATVAQGLQLDGNTLYGACIGDGLQNNNSGGTVFRLNTDGSGFATLHAFPPLWQGEIPTEPAPQQGLPVAAICYLG